MFQLLLIFMAIAATALPTAAQSPIRLMVSEPQPADSADIEYYGEKHPVRTIATVVGLNTAVWAFDHFIRDTDYSEISFKTIKDNIEHGFVWDNDAIGTNMFMHPYNGNLYFNAARSNGYNFWASSLTALTGSFLWEMCMENEYPSTNDIIATPIGGTAVGEVAYRTSDMLLDDRSTGIERVGREAAITLISPMRGLTRILNGDMWRVRETSGRQFGTPNLAMEVSAGARFLGMKNSDDEGVMGAALQVNIDYGDRFELHSDKPYDYFTLRVDLAAQKSQPVLREVNITGRLVSREIIDCSGHQMSAGVYQHYDYYDSDTLSKESKKVPYKLAIPASVGGGMMYRYHMPKNFAVDAYAHANGVILGGILSDHYMLDQRNYNLASGFSIKGGTRLVLSGDILSAQVGYEYYRLFTWGYPRGVDLSRANPHSFNSQGDQSAAYFGIAEARIDYKLSKHLYLSGSWMHFSRSTRYRDFQDVKTKSYSVRLMLTYKI